MSKPSPHFLIEHIKSTHKELVEKSFDGLETLQNMKYPNIADTGLWYDAKHYATIITTDLFEKEPLESTFSICINGKHFRKRFAEKYISNLTISEVDDVLQNLLVVVNSVEFGREL